MSVEGIWNLSVHTPVGMIEVVVEISRPNGVLTGTAYGPEEQVPLSDVVLESDLITWKQAVTKPMRLNLAFAVTVTGDTLTGTAKAGRLPASKVTGRRRTV
ncbi:hypothetical protein J8N05_14585 [Streptomyces sp. BH-SS-21]|uniref:Uncharacterized protein n=1 Tax=Streptomyces liliiviolaceus TaxID=2823109 RepID=A0A940Y2H9_9ACTN|nr:hypothetical protein [Streptomyces liliiviolaceus]MBQ0849429.1 hypothetical protein [Streptomyces liliiviolaceus]